MGPLSDNFKDHRKLFVSIGTFGRGISLLIMYIAINIKSLELFIGAIFFQGCSVLVFWTPLDMLISEKSSEEFRTKAFGKRTYMIGIGCLVGTLIAFGIIGLSTYFFPQYIWLFYSPLVVFALFNFYAGIKVYSVIADEVKEILISHDNASNEINNKQNDEMRIIIGFILLLIVTFLISINNTFANPFLQAYLIENIVEDPMIVMLIYFPSMIFGYILAPKLSKFSDSVNIYLSITLICVFGAISTWIVISTTSGLIFSAVLIFDSLYLTVEDLIKQNYTSKISSKHRGKIFSAMYFVQYTGAIIAPIIGGFVWENFGHKTPFQITILVEILLIVPYLLAIYYLIPIKKSK